MEALQVYGIMMNCLLINDLQRMGGFARSENESEKMWRIGGKNQIRKKENNWLGSWSW